MEFSKWVLSLIFTFASLSESVGFTVTIPGIFGYEDKPVLVHLNPTNCPSSINDDLDAAINLWNSAPGSRLLLEKSTETSSSVNSYRSFAFSDSHIVIGCSTDFNTDSGGCDASCLAGVIAVGSAISSGGFLQKGFVVINQNSGVGGNYGNKGTTIRRVTLAHELGHALGLGHTEDVAALMYYNVSKKSYLSLSQDDVDGINYLYPRDEVSDNLPFGLDEEIYLGCGSSNPPGGWNGLLLWILPLGLLLFLKNRPLPFTSV